MFYCRIKNIVSFYTMEKRQKVLFVCTGNSCRSQIAEGLLKHKNSDRYDVFSAGSNPSRVHPSAITVMKEWDIDISGNSSDSLDEYLNMGIDIVITVCDDANQVCPVFPGNVHRYHWSIDDPFCGWNPEPSQLDNFRETRQILNKHILEFLNTMEQQ